MTPKIEIFGQQFAHFGGFDGSFLTILGVKKSFSGLFSKLFRKCLGNVLSLKSPTFSLLGSREAFNNVDKASPGLFINKNLQNAFVVGSFSGQREKTRRKIDIFLLFCLLLIFAFLLFLQKGFLLIFTLSWKSSYSRNSFSKAFFFWCGKNKKQIFYRLTRFFQKLHKIKISRGNINYGTSGQL